MAGTPIYDEVQKFMDAIQKEAPKVASAFEKVGQAFQGWQVQIDQWGQQFGKNQCMIGVEAANQAWFAAERKNRERKERLKKERENCLHGRSPFPINMGLGVRLKCPRCYGYTVYVGAERLFCFLCGWSRWRVGKRPS